MQKALILLSSLFFATCAGNEISVVIPRMSSQPKMVDAPPLQPKVTDTFYPVLRNGDRLWLDAALLYFLPHEKCIAMTNKFTDLFTTADVTDEPVVKPHFDWDFGYRVGLGYIFESRRWDMSLQWTHFNTGSHQTRSTDGDIEFGMFPIWSLADDILPYDWVAASKSHWRLNLNLLDLDFGRLYGFGKVFFLRPFAGVRSAWINQDLDIRYRGGIFYDGLDLLDLDSTFGPDYVDMKNNFYGIGPRLGIEPQLNLGGGLRIYASASGEGQYGFYNVHQKETYFKTVRYHKNRYPQEWVWMADAGAGLLWKTYFARQRCALTFQLGWEYHIFFDQVKLKGDKFGLVSGNRNLSLNGADFSMRFDF